MLERHHDKRVRVYASSAIADFPKTTEAAKERIRKVEILDKKKTVAAVNGVHIDYSWLKGASETYQISDDIKDYCIQEVPIVTVGIPNRNLHSFPFSEVSHFDPRFGQFVYRTFVGKPTFADHCFPAGTLISTQDGLKAIEKLEIGDLVLTDKMRYRPVTQLFSNGIKPVVRLKIQGIMEHLEVTENHPILVVDRRQVFDEKNQTCQQKYKPHFRAVSDVYVGDYVAIPRCIVDKDITIVPENGGRGIIADNLLLMPILDIIDENKEVNVYNIEVEEDHTYVAGGIIVHNCNKNHLEAKGVHFDSSLRYVPGWDVWKIYVLLGYDRTKDTTLARQIEKGQRRSYSMGAWVSYFLSSLTGQIENSNQPLKYPKGTVHNNKLSYSLCTGCEFFETSSVVGPADVTAESHQIWYF